MQQENSEAKFAEIGDLFPVLRHIRKRYFITTKLGVEVKYKEA